ncbi:ruBisCO large subunit-binding protein subunit alpha, chloroplastic-like [Gossypium australe]|uniref:RuBisCO large subunit-binding protein subunit alpha, chloroplastic-like n=1 Tax=Gossypium australe TaxID=47621 RepID=A0A5B6X2V9_9ROSI|nr:ruBisCO large subunit-binding protein subunit alpha, chloroplastic-like [Gossypium australe]
MSSVRNVHKLLCDFYGRPHIEEFRYKAGACLRCGATDHFGRTCLKPPGEKDDRSVKPPSMPQKGRCPGKNNNAWMSCTDAKDATTRSKVRALARTYYIRAREESTGPVVTVESGILNNFTRVVSTITAQKIISKGWEAFLAYILDTWDSGLKLDQVPIVNESAEVYHQNVKLNLLLI